MPTDRRIQEDREDQAGRKKVKAAKLEVKRKGAEGAVSQHANVA